MSRSRKYHPYYKDRPSKGMKRIYNKRIRQALKDHELRLDYKSYRKLDDSYDLSDWHDRPGSFENYYKSCVRRWYMWRYRYEPYPTRETVWKKYLKRYLRK